VAERVSSNESTVIGQVGVVGVRRNLAAASLSDSTQRRTRISKK
jgi:hypothetical protein